MAKGLIRALSAWKRFSRRKKVITVLSAIMVLVIAAVAIGYAYLYNQPRKVVSIDSNGDLVVSNDTGGSLDGRVNILLIAADSRANQKSATYNTDTLILASIDPNTKQIALLSVPRDTRIQIPKVGWGKINSAAAYGGLNMTVAMVQQLTGVKINGYIKTDFAGFKSIIDTLGGITVNVEKNMYYETGDAQDGIINLKKGVQVLDGEKALEYARFRHDALADISRTARQQVILKAVAKKLMEPGTILKIPTLIPQFYTAVETNLPLSDLINIAKVAVHFDSSNVISQTLPGWFLSIDGISYWGVDQKQAKQVAADLLHGKVYGNSPDKLIEASTDPAGANQPSDTRPQVQVGSISFPSPVTTNAVTLAISASSGVVRAELYRNSGSGAILVKSWPGGALNWPDNGLKPGTQYTYWIQVYDSQGHMFPGNTVSVTTQQEQQETTTPQPTQNLPGLSVTTPKDHFVVSTDSIPVNGSAEGAGTVIVTVGNWSKQLDVSSSSSFDVNVPLQPGNNSIIVMATNDAGSATETVTGIYLAPPSLNTPQENSTITTSAATVRVSGSAVPGSTVRINQTQIQTDAKGNFDYPYPVSSGSTPINISVTAVLDGVTSSPSTRTVYRK